MENFTADSLQNFIRRPPARSILDEEMDLNAGDQSGRKPQIPRGKPRTARAERIGQILESISTRAAEQGPADPQASGPRYHDAQIRHHMGELVRQMLQEGRKEDLGTILQTHQRFIEEVLGLVRQK